MAKQKSFEKAHQLRKSGLSYKLIAEVVSAVEGRKKPYSSSTMYAWCRAKTWEEYRGNTTSKPKAKETQLDRIESMLKEITEWIA